MAFEELDKKWLVGARKSYLGFAKVESARRGSVIECFQEIIHDHLQLWEGHKTTWIMLRAFQTGAGVDMRLVSLKFKQRLQIWHTYSDHLFLTYNVVRNKEIICSCRLVGLIGWLEHWYTLYHDKGSCTYYVITDRGGVSPNDHSIT